LIILSQGNDSLTISHGTCTITVASADSRTIKNGFTQAEAPESAISAAAAGGPLPTDGVVARRRDDGQPRRGGPAHKRDHRMVR
jgi:hypothetical protein